MQPMQGEGTLTFDDGTVAEIERVSFDFITHRGAMSGQGTFRHPEAMLLATKAGSPTLEVEGRRIKVIITRATGDGIGVIQSNGGPLT